MSEVKDKVFYHHFRLHNGGVVTVAFQPDSNRDSANRKVLFGVSWCSPRDRWHRKKGNALALERLNDPVQQDWTEVWLDKDGPFFAQVKEHLRTVVLASPDAPGWAKRGKLVLPTDEPPLCDCGKYVATEGAEPPLGASLKRRVFSWLGMV